jgi:hypothetical protein
MTIFDRHKALFLKLSNSVIRLVLNMAQNKATSDHDNVPVFDCVDEFFFRSRI